MKTDFSIYLIIMMIIIMLSYAAILDIYNEQQMTNAFKNITVCKPFIWYLSLLQSVILVCDCLYFFNFSLKYINTTHNYQQKIDIPKPVSFTRAFLFGAIIGILSNEDSQFIKMF